MLWSSFRGLNWTNVSFELTGIQATRREEKKVEVQGDNKEEMISGLKKTQKDPGKKGLSMTDMIGKKGLNAKGQENATTMTEETGSTETIETEGIDNTEEEIVVTTNAKVGTTIGVKTQSTDDVYRENVKTIRSELLYCTRGVLLRVARATGSIVCIFLFLLGTFYTFFASILPCCLLTSLTKTPKALPWLPYISFWFPLELLTLSCSYSSNCFIDSTLRPLYIVWFLVCAAVFIVFELQLSRDCSLSCRSSALTWLSLPRDLL